MADLPRKRRRLRIIVRAFPAFNIYPLQDVGWEYYDGNFPLFEPDEPMTAPEIQEAGKQIIRRVYRFRYLLFVAANNLLFPPLAFYLHNLKLGWGRWYRSRRNNLIRFGGWITLRQWSADFGRGDFLRRLQAARNRLGLSPKPTPICPEADRATQTLGSIRSARHQE